LEVNVLGTLNALEVCRLHSAKIIFASTYVYGEPQHLPIREDHPLVATNPYTESKLLGERLCASYHRDYGVRCIVLRAFNIYGPGQGGSFLIPSIIEQARHGRVRLRSATPRRDFVHVQDATEAYARAIASEKDGFAVYNIGSGVSYSVSDVAALIKGKLDAPVEITYSNETRDGEVFDTVADIERARLGLGWEPKIGFELGIESCVRGWDLTV
jgi:UDP-glucose 4-epimerase